MKLKLNDKNEDLNNFDTLPNTKECDGFLCLEACFLWILFASTVIRRKCVIKILIKYLVLLIVLAIPKNDFIKLIPGHSKFASSSLHSSYLSSGFSVYYVVN